MIIELLCPTAHIRGLLPNFGTVQSKFHSFQACLGMKIWPVHALYIARHSSRSWKRSSHRRLRSFMYFIAAEPSLILVYMIKCCIPCLMPHTNFRKVGSKSLIFFSWHMLLTMVSCILYHIHECMFKNLSAVKWSFRSKFLNGG